MTNKTMAETIWEEIKDLPIDLFSLPQKKVSDFCVFKFIEPSKLYLVPKTASSFLAALEKSIGPKYALENVLSMVVVSKIPTLGDDNAV